ncbi:unnamed protein product [Closterium sp. NIES-53]
MTKFGPILAQISRPCFVMDRCANDGESTQRAAVAACCNTTETPANSATAPYWNNSSETDDIFRKKGVKNFNKAPRRHSRRFSRRTVFPTRSPFSPTAPSPPTISVAQARRAANGAAPTATPPPPATPPAAAPPAAAPPAAAPPLPLSAASSRRFARRVLQLERDEGHECHPTREELRVGYHCMVEHDQWLHVNRNCWHAHMPSVQHVTELLLQFPNLASVRVPLRGDVALGPGDVRMVLYAVAGLGALRSCHVQADVAGWVEREERQGRRDEETEEEEEKEKEIARERERRWAEEDGTVVKVAARELVARRGREIRRERKEARRAQERQQRRKELSRAIEAGLLGVVSRGNGGNSNCLPAVLQSGSPFSALTSLKELQLRLRVAGRGARLSLDLFLGLESRLQKLTLLHTPCSSGDGNIGCNGDGDGGGGGGDGGNGERGAGGYNEVVMVMPGSAWRLSQLQELETSFRVPFDDDQEEFEEGRGLWSRYLGLTEEVLEEEGEEQQGPAHTPAAAAAAAAGVAAPATAAAAPAGAETGPIRGLASLPLLSSLSLRSSLGLPPSIRHLRHLTRLLAPKALSDTSDSLSLLPNLQSLSMMADGITAGPPLPASLRRLQLRYNWCSLLHAAGRAAGSVEHLEVSAVGAGGQDSCVYGDLVPTLSPHRWDPAWGGEGDRFSFPNLREMIVTKCWGGAMEIDMGPLPSLTYLSVFWSVRLHGIDQGWYSNLRFLHLYQPLPDCHWEGNPEGELGSRNLFAHLPNLHTLVVDNCCQLGGREMLASLSVLTQLHTLRLSIIRNEMWTLTSRTEVPWWAWDHGLEAYYRNTEVSHLKPEIACPASLRELQIVKCDLPFLPPSLAAATALTELTLHHWTNLQTLPSFLSSFTELREIRVTGCGETKPSAPPGLLPLLKDRIWFHSVDCDGCRELQKREPCRD